MTALENRRLLRAAELEDVNACYCCGSDRRRVVLEQAGLKYVECEQCRLVYIHPRLSPAVYGRVYGRRYWFGRRRGHGERTLANRAFMRERRASAERVLELMQPHLQPGDSLIDYGCGDGSLVSVARRAGYNARGFEISPHLQSFARRHYSHAPIFLSHDDLLAASRGRRASLLFLRDVLEHFYQPVEELRRAMQLLEPGGLVYIETVDADDGFDEAPARWRHTKPFEHPYLFRSQHVRQIVERAGARIVGDLSVPTRCHLLARRDELRTEMKCESKRRSEVETTQTELER